MELTSRWPWMRGRVTRVPAEYFVLPQEVIDASKPKDPAASNPLDKLEQVGEPVVGLDAADELRKVMVYVLRRKP